MVKTPNQSQRNCIQCKKSRAKKGGHWFCTLKMQIVLPEEMVAVEECSHLYDNQRRVAQLMAESQKLRRQRELEQPSSDAKRHFA